MIYSFFYNEEKIDMNKACKTSDNRLALSEDNLQMKIVIK